MRGRLHIVMGVAGCGKSTIGRGIADAMGGRYIEGDELHPQDNIDKMSAGTPLTDADRMPWLTAVADTMLDASVAANGPIFAGCSALKRRYRDHITATADQPVTFVFLDGSRELIEQRMKERTGHFMPTSLLDSQFADLERPADDERCVRVDIAQDLSHCVRDAVRQLQDAD